MSFFNSLKSYKSSRYNLFEDHFNRASLGSDWIRTGSGGATININNNKMRLTGASSGDDIIRWSLFQTCFEEFIIECYLTPRTAIGSSNFGVGFGIRSNNSQSITNNCMQLVGTSTNAGKWAFYSSTSHTSLGSSKSIGGGYSFVADTTYKVKITFSKRTWTAELYSLSGILLSTHSHTTASMESEVSSLGGTFKVGNFALWAVGGTWDVDDIRVSIPSNFINCKAVVLGDSISKGSSSTSPDTRFFGLLQSQTNSVLVNHSCGANTTGSIVNSLAKVLELQPEYAILMIGGNDVLFGVADATMKANYQSIVTQLEAIGTTVIHCTPTPRNATDVTGLRDWIMTDYAGGNIYDSYASLQNSDMSNSIDPSFNSGDGTHPNNAGHQKWADDFVDAYPEAIGL